MSTRGHHGLLLGGSGGVDPAITVTSQAFPNGSSNHVVNLPAVAAGDLLVIYFCCAGNGLGSTTTTPAGWTLLGSSPAGGGRNSIYYRIADGSETTVNFHTPNSTSTPGVSFTVKVPAGNYVGTPEAAVANNATNPKPVPSLSPSWGTASPTLWIAGVNYQNVATAIAAYAYADNQTYLTAPTGIAAALSTMQSTAASSPSGSYTSSGGTTTGCIGIIAVRRTG